MKRMLKHVVLVGAMVATGAAVADFGIDSGIVGIDYKFSRTKRSGYIPNKAHNGASVYLGSRFCENFGVELGYDWSARKTRNFSGVLAAPNGTFRGNASSTTRLSQWRLDLNGYLPIESWEGFDLIGSVGLGAARTKLSFTENGTLTRTSGVSVPVSHNYSGSRTRCVWRLGVGAQYMIGCNVGVRAMYRYEGLAGNNSHNTITGNTIKLSKNASSFALGLFYQF